MNLRDVTMLHHMAMRLADRADSARRHGEQENARHFLRGAYEHEREAALTCPVTFQPSRAILMRSAACLGKEAGLVDAAEALVRQALAEPGVPTEIAEELRAVLVRPR